MRLRPTSIALAALLLVGSQMAYGAPPTNPKVLDEHSAAQYRIVGRKIFHHGVKVTDFDQRKIGDCWFAAGTSAVAHQMPKAIKRAFKANPDGTVKVRLFV